MSKAAWFAGVAVLLVLVALYAARKVIAREALVGWLRSHGVASDIAVQGLGLGQFGGRVRIGAPGAPAVVAGDVAVTYGFRRLSFEVRSITLRRTTLRARLHGGTLSLGVLDPLIEDFRKRPVHPDTPGPRVDVDGAVVLLATDAGPIRLVADATIVDGRLVSLTARSDPAHLQGKGFDATAGTVALSLKTSGQRVSLRLSAPFDSAQAGGMTLKSGRLKLTGDAPYPDVKGGRLEGPVALHADLAAAGFNRSGSALTAIRIAANFRGQAKGGVKDFGLGGVLVVDLDAASAAAGGVRLGGIRASARIPDARWARLGGDAISATPQMTASLQTLTAGNLRLSELRAKGQSAVRVGPSGAQATVVASVGGHGAWTGLGPMAADDPPSLEVLKRAAQGFQIAAPSVSVSLRAGAVSLALPQSLRISADHGGAMTLSGRADAPLIGPREGGFRLEAGGGGLPTLSADVRHLRVAGGAIDAEGAAKISGSFGPVEAGSLAASGVLRIADGGLTFTAERCAPASARKVIFGTNDIEQLSVRLCPWRAPMFALAKTRWRLRADIAGLAADAPFLQARLVDGAGRLTAGQAAGSLTVTAVLDEGKGLDDARQTRFNPLRIGATARLSDARWTGDIRLATQAGQPFARAGLTHDTRSGLGGLTLDTGSLVFSAHGLQPAQLSPLAEALGAPVEGRAQFTGRVDWRPAGVTSNGTLSVPGLDLQSPAGRVTGLRGTLAFTSLSPLTAAPGQMLSADRIAAIVPITGITATFGLDDRALTITGGAAAVGGGRVRIESLSLPLAVNAPMTGVLRLDAVQLHELVEASPFGDRVDLDAKVSGRVPFEGQAGKVRIGGAELHAIQPGRLSINRQALTGVAASGSVSAPTGPAAPVAANDTFTDFAYQAMENLAFDKLDAAIASRADGRLGIVAHVVGRHDPPQHQEIKLSLFDLIRRKFLTKPLLLPSDTGVDLTLDTTLNLDDLLTDYADYQRLRGSRPVQPAGPTVETKPLETPR